MRWLLERLLVRQLRRDLRRIEWIGELPRIPPDRPVVIYSNHVAFHDSLVLGFLTRRVLQRQPCVWMEEYDRFPIFRRVGALPFPPDDPRRRAATIRRTVERMGDLRAALIYFPEGRLHPPEEGVLEFPPDLFFRLERAIPPAYWWPIALKLSSWESARPTATLIGGAVESRPAGDEREKLASLLPGLADHTAARITLLEGRRGPDERWGWAARLLGKSR